MLARLSTGALLLLAVCACNKASPTSPEPPRAGPRTLYVSLGGNNANDGSATAPWRTLRYAVGQLQAGDTLYLRGGDYTGPNNTIDSQLGTVRSGTSFSNAITIAGYPGEVVTIQPPAGMHGVGLKDGDPHHIIVQDVIIDMVNSAGIGGNGPGGVFISNAAHHNRILRVEIKNNGGNGIMIYGTGAFNEVLQSDIHHNGQFPGENQGYGAYVTTSDNLFDGNDIHHNGGYGLHFYEVSDGLVNRNVIRNNKIHHNGTGGGTNYGIVVARGDGNEINYNDIYDNRGGILVYTNSTNAQVYNNTLRSNGPLEGILIQFARGTVVRDNRLNGSSIVDLGVNTVLSNNH